MIQHSRFSARLLSSPVVCLRTSPFFKIQFNERGLDSKALAFTDFQKEATELFFWHKNDERDEDDQILKVHYVVIWEETQ